MRIGKLTVIENAPAMWDRAARAKCQCDCGNSITIRTKYLQSGNMKSCGCINTTKQNSERVKIMVENGYTTRQIAARLDMTFIEAQAYLKTLGLTVEIRATRQKNVQPQKPRKLRTWNLVWTEEKCAELTELASEEGATYGGIAQKMGKSVFSVTAQMKKMGLKASLSPQWVRRVFDKMPEWVRFEDVTPEEIRRGMYGKKPSPETNRYSLVGCTAAMAST